MQEKCRWPPAASSYEPTPRRDAGAGFAFGEAELDLPRQFTRMWANDGGETIRSALRLVLDLETIRCILRFVLKREKGDPPPTLHQSSMNSIRVNWRRLAGQMKQKSGSGSWRGRRGLNSKVTKERRAQPLGEFVVMDSLEA